MVLTDFHLAVGDELPDSVRHSFTTRYGTSYGWFCLKGRGGLSAISSDSLHTPALEHEQVKMRWIYCAALSDSLDSLRGKNHFPWNNERRYFSFVGGNQVEDKKRERANSRTCLTGWCEGRVVQEQVGDVLICSKYFNQLVWLRDAKDCDRFAVYSYLGRGTSMITKPTLVCTLYVPSKKSQNRVSLFPLIYNFPHKGRQ